MTDDRTDTIAQTAMYGGAGASVLLFGLNASEVATLVSTVIAIAGFIVHVVYQIRKDAREQQYHQARMAQLDPDTVILKLERDS